MMSSTTTLGRFRIEGQFASTGPGRLYRGINESGRSVLLSVVPAALAHGAAVAADSGLRLMDLGTLESGEVYLAYDIPAGETLAQRLDRGALGWSSAAFAFLPVVQKLQQCHSDGQIYGDIAPTKMVLRHDGTLALIGRELAELNRAFDRRTNEPASPSEDMAPYLSPESARGDGPTPASDVFSVGAVVFEAVVGRRAFDAQNLLALLHQVQALEVPELKSYDPAVPAVLSDAVALALSKDPGRRPSAASLVESLATACAMRPRSDVQQTSVAPQAAPSAPRPTPHQVQAMPRRATPAPPPVGQTNADEVVTAKIPEGFAAEAKRKMADAAAVEPPGPTSPPEGAPETAAKPELAGSSTADTAPQAFPPEAQAEVAAAIASGAPPVTVPPAPADGVSSTTEGQAPAPGHATAAAPPPANQPAPAIAAERSQPFVSDDWFLRTGQAAAAAVKPVEGIAASRQSRASRYYWLAGLTIVALGLGALVWGISSFVAMTRDAANALREASKPFDVESAEGPAAQVPTLAVPLDVEGAVKELNDLSEALKLLDEAAKPPSAPDLASEPKAEGTAALPEPARPAEAGSVEAAAPAPQPTSPEAAAAPKPTKSAVRTEPKRTKAAPLRREPSPSKATAKPTARAATKTEPLPARGASPATKTEPTEEPSAGASKDAALKDPF